MLSPWDKFVIARLAQTRRQRRQLVRVAVAARRGAQRADEAWYIRPRGWREAVGQVAIVRVRRNPRALAQAAAALGLYLCIVAYIIYGMVRP